MPTVTVLLPVRNGGKYLRESLSSILTQSHSNWEICIIDDGSNDNTPEIIAGFDDNRITKLVNPSGMGVAYSLNRGIRETRSDYIIRTDADDISLPDRIARQVAFMENNSHVGISGTWVEHIGRYQGTLERRPVGPETVKAFLLLDNPIIHPTCIMRRSSLEHYSLWYNADYSRSEDYDLWERASHFFSLDNIPEPLVKFRVHGESVTETHGQEMWQQTYNILRRNLSRLRLNISDEGIAFHRAMSHGELVDEPTQLEKASSWFQKLLEVNATLEIYPQDAFQEAIGFVWFRLCRNNSLHGPVVWRMYNKTNLSSWYSAPSQDRFIFVLAVLYHFFRRKKSCNA